MALSNQMEMFEDGGLKDEGGMTDEVSGNDVPSGSTREEVRDDIPAQLSEGEFVFPADVVRFLGLEKLMQMRQKAKMGLQKMEDMGQMGNSDEATMPDDMPFDLNDLDMQEDVDNEEDVEYNKGGVVKAAVGAYVPPALPTSNPYDPTKNVYSGTTNIIPESYMPAKDLLNSPSPDNKFGLGAQAGMDSEMFEQRRYVNEATGQVRSVSFNKATGQTSTNIKQLLDQGFIRKDEPIKEAAKTATPTPNYRPRPQEQDDGGSSYEEQQKEEEMYGLGAGRISLGGSTIGNRVKTGFGSGANQKFSQSTTGATTFGIGYTKPGKDKYSLGKGLGASALGPIGGFGMSALEAISYGNGNIPEGGTAKFTLNGISIVKPAEVANAILKKPMGVEAKALVELHELLTKERDTLVERDKTLTRKEASKIIETYYKLNEKYKDGDFYDPKSTDAIDLRAQVAKNEARAASGYFDDSSNFESQSSDSSDPYDGGLSDADISGETGVNIDDYNKGGLAGKNKTRKTKKMKRGGLASR